MEQCKVEQAGKSKLNLYLPFVLSFVGAYLSVRFLTRYFENRSLRPVGIYCIVVGVACLALFTLRG